MVRLHLPNTISREQAQSKINIYAGLGDHGYQPRPRTGPEVVTLFRSMGLDFSRVVEQCRDYRKPVPGLENLAGSRWKTSGHVSVLDRATGEVIQEVKGSGEISLSSYQSHLEDACESRDEAIAKTSFSATGRMAVQGIASIEAFFLFAADRWNRLHPDDPLHDSKQHKVSLEAKCRSWVPKMCRGASLRRDDRAWSDFIYLQRLRDVTVHPRRNSVGGSVADLAKAINAFKHGIALQLGRLHALVGCALPAVVINAHYLPDVEVVEAES